MNANTAATPPGKSSMRALAGIVLTACAIGFSGIASATNINIAAVTFVPRDPADFITSKNGQVTQGTLDKASGRFYAPIIFPSTGKICSLSLIYRDNDPSSDITIKLFKKKFGIGQTPFITPAQLTVLQSNSTDPATRRLFQTTFSESQIDLNAFYYAEVNVPSDNLQVLGVQINFRPNNVCGP